MSSRPRTRRAWTWPLALLLGAVPGAVLGSPSSATEPSGSPTITVAAASDLRYAMDDLVAAFTAEHTGPPVTVTYGSTGNLFAQVSQGAPFDVLFSADLDHARRLEEAGLANPGSTRRYARGRLALWVPHASPLDVEGLGMATLLDPAAERVAIANPEHAPYGRAAQAALGSAGLWEAVRPRIVMGESISQAAQFVESGAADIGIIALSLAIAPPLSREGRHALVPAELHPPIDQGAVVLRAAADPTAAASFLGFVLGSQGRAVLDRYGLLPPED